MSILYRDVEKCLAFGFHLSGQEVSKVLQDTLHSFVGEFELTWELENGIFGDSEQAELDIMSLILSAYLNTIVVGCLTLINQSDSAHSSLCPNAIIHLT